MISLREILNRLYLGEISIEEAERVLSQRHREPFTFFMAELFKEKEPDNAKKSKLAQLELKMKEAWNAYIDLRKEYLKGGE